MSEQSYFSQKKILITGAASGIGWLLTDALSQYDCDLILIDINQDGLSKTASRFEHRPSQITAFQADLSSKESLQNICEKFNDIDILINNAGIVSGKKVQDLNYEHIQRTFAINTIAPMTLTQHFLKDMISKKSGHIVNISSASAFTGVAKLSDYAASKAALASFDESLRFEIQNNNWDIKTTLICPFYMNTGMFSGVKSKFSFLLPIMNPQVCADKMIDAIEKQQTRLIMPKSVYLIFLVRLLPQNLADKVLHFLGVNKSMDDFIGRK